jgi:hypothetical protein
MKDIMKVKREVIIDAKKGVGGFTLGSTVNFFQLSPCTTTTTPWKMTRFNGKKYKNIEDVEKVFTVNFKISDHIINALGDIGVQEKKKLLELELLQSAIFIVDIPDVIESPEDNCSNDWCFSGKGITLSDSDDNPEYSIQSQVKNQGKTLVITINKVRYTNDSKKQTVLGFRFIAICLNKNSGGELDKVYYSQDPRIGVRRIKV